MSGAYRNQSLKQRLLRGTSFGSAKDERRPKIKEGDGWLWSTIIPLRCADSAAFSPARHFAAIEVDSGRLEDITVWSLGASHPALRLTSLLFRVLARRCCPRCVRGTRVVMMSIAVVWMRYRVRLLLPNARLDGPIRGFSPVPLPSRPPMHARTSTWQGARRPPPCPVPPTILVKGLPLPALDGL